MKKQILSLLIISSCALSWGQTQIGNSNFENWETVADGEEPVNWNSFLSASGSFAQFASDQCESSSDVRPGSSGTKSARIFSLNIFGTIANGNLTVGKINMGSATPTSTSNYNSSITSDANFSEAFTVNPDSIVFWAKYTPTSGNTTDSARVSAIIHDNYAFRDPIDANSEPHIVGTAINNFAKTDGNWIRIAVPFNYSGPASTAAYILVTFASCYTPGGGQGNDALLVDDVELIYNPLGVDEADSAPIQVINANGKITFKAKEGATAAITIVSENGSVVATGKSDQTFELKSTGIYMIHMVLNGKSYTQKVAVY